MDVSFVQMRLIDKRKCIQLQAFVRLVGLVVKTSASRAEVPGFESRLRRDFSGVESYL